MHAPVGFRRLQLHDGWTVSAIGPTPLGSDAGEIAAVVPGVVHTDLRRAGLIADPFDAANESDQQWIGDTDWRYETTFEWSDDGHTRHDLVAEGLDTVATIELNGSLVGTTQNQHRSHRFDVRHLLRAGMNHLVITFTAPVPEAERRSAEHGPLPHVNHHPYNALRKSASNFGWDWGIDVATSGIWRPIAIESWSGVRVARTRHLVSIGGVSGSGAPTGETTAPTGELTVVAELERDGQSPAEPVRLTLQLEGRTAEVVAAATETQATVSISEPNVRLWWPRGHGEQALYAATLSLADDPTGHPSWKGRIGFRTTSVNTAPEPAVDGNDAGSPFEVSVNGRLIQVRGANWIPDHAFVTEIDRARYGRRIDDAVEANVNLLRVWGGGIYESEDFYEQCDEAGLLVWQDFLFACAAYAEEEWLADEVEAEAREQIARLSAHASLAVWNGNNENIWLRIDRGWRHDLIGRTWGNGYYRDLLPGLLAELDPTRAYSPASPYSFDDYLHPNDPHNGTMHVWDVWNQIDYAHYRDYPARFVSEFGFQGPPAWSTLTAVVHDEPLSPYGPQMLVHQKADQGNLKLERGLGEHLPVPTDIDDWHWATQLNQANAVRFGIEHFRSLAPANSGVIVWQLNDNWPVISWAAVDFDEHRKPLWYALQAAYAPRFATLQPRGDGLALVLMNDHPDAWAGELLVKRMTVGGQTLAEHTVAAAVDARGTTTLSLPDAVARPADEAAELIVATIGDGFERALFTFAEPKALHLEHAPYTAHAQKVEGGYRVTVSATSYVRDLFLQADRVDPQARVDRGLVTLLAGEEAVLTVQSGAEVDPARFIDSLVLRAANDLVS